jgi:hypothetical protein
MYLSLLDQESEFQKLQSLSVNSGNKMVVKASERRLKMIPEKNIRRYSGEHIPKAPEVRHQDFLSQVKYFVNNMKKINEMLSYEDIVEAFPKPQEYLPPPPIKSYVDTNVINVMAEQFKPLSELIAQIPPYINASATHTPIHPVPTSSTKDILTNLPIVKLGDLLLDNVVLNPQPLPPAFVFKLEDEPYEMHHGEKFLQEEHPLHLHEIPHKRNDKSDKITLPFGSSSDRDDRLNRILIDKNSKIRFEKYESYITRKNKTST